MNDLLKQWKIEENATFEGWDFSYLEGRWESEFIGWDYDVFVREYLTPDSVLLDMGTGGGEYLLSLNHPYDLTFATEAYPPNYQLCQDTLAPLGITVKRVFSDTKIPFSDKQFDIVINRHESFDISEVKRILKPNGIFITQQIDRNSQNLAERVLPNHVKTSPTHNLLSNMELIKRQNLHILYENESFTKTKFYDIGAFIYFAKIIEWEFPGFSVENCFKELYHLHDEIERQGYIEKDEHHFIIISQNKDT